MSRAKITELCRAFDDATLPYGPSGRQRASGRTRSELLGAFDFNSGISLRDPRLSSSARHGWDQVNIERTVCNCSVTAAIKPS